MPSLDIVNPRQVEMCVRLLPIYGGLETTMAFDLEGPSIRLSDLVKHFEQKGKMLIAGFSLSTECTNRREPNRDSMQSKVIWLPGEFISLQEAVSQRLKGVSSAEEDGKKGALGYLRTNPLSMQTVLKEQILIPEGFDEEPSHHQHSGARSPARTLCGQILAKAKPSLHFGAEGFYMVLTAGLEPARPKATDFKSAASTDSATRARMQCSAKSPALNQKPA